MTYSQNNEDAVIEDIFKLIGFRSKRFVEFGFHCNENNSRNLIENHNFKGLFIDSDINECLRANHFYRKRDRDGQRLIKVRNYFLSKKNINVAINRHYEGEIDFLSIDVDGVDLHLLDTINVIEPRVICIEYCASIGKDRSVTVKYKDNFDRHKEHNSGMYCNASLRATVNVMRKKGYKLVATVFGLNALFVKNDEPMDEVSIDEAFESHHGRTKTMTQEEQYNIIKDLEWINVNEKGEIKNE